jgi:hypothetical protein
MLPAGTDGSNKGIAAGSAHVAEAARQCTDVNLMLAWRQCVPCTPGQANLRDSLQAEVPTYNPLSAHRLLFLPATSLTSTEGTGWCHRAG